MKRIISIALLACSLTIYAQDKSATSNFGIKFSGFVKSDFIYDSRQTINIREGHFLLYPDNILKDALGTDINASPSFNILSIQTRLKGTITGPDAFGAKTMGVIEADFFGNENAAFVDANGFRLRHAFVKLSWKHSELLAGQYWHPFFIPEAFPAVISFNTGAPFQPFSRNPQLRYTYKYKQLKVMAAALTQRDFQGTGPDGSNTKYLRNSGIPEFNFQLQFKPDSADHQINAGISYKTIKPELFTQNNGKTKKFETNVTLSGLSYFGSVMLAFKPVKIKLYGVYAENATDLTMLGGYAVSKLNDTSTGSKSFINLNTMSAWAEIQSTGKKVQYALFVGYSKNMGANDTIKGYTDASKGIYARASNIDYMYRIAPRVMFISGKLNIAFELEYTSAFYGTANGNKKGGVSDAKEVSNIRGLLAFIYNF
jgi:hypothetical protein